jgi:YD repeat-containing protein
MMNARPPTRAIFVAAVNLAVFGCSGNDAGGRADAGPPPDMQAAADSDQPVIEGAAQAANPDECVVEMYLLDHPVRHGRLQAHLGRWRFDAATRILAGPFVTYELDAQDRMVKRTENNAPQFSSTYSYDSNGYCTGVTFNGGGGAFLYQNHYQGDRRVRVDATSSGPQRPLVTRTGYRYEDPTSPLWTHQDIYVESAGVVDRFWKRDLVAGFTTRFELRTGAEAKLDTVFTHQYEGGRLKVRQRDHGYWPWMPADGQMDLSMTWSYDTEGRLLTFEQDGVDTFDDPRIDGVADVREVFSLGCQPLIARFPWVGNLPASDHFTFGDQPQ